MLVQAEPQPSGSGGRKARMKSKTTQLSADSPARRCSDQYRVVWKREGWVKPKKKNYWTKKGAEKLLALLGDEPWKAFGKEPHERYCCNGHECGCMGATWEEMLMEGRKDFPRLEYARLEQRTVVMGDWEQNPGVLLPPLGGGKEQRVVGGPN